MFLLILGAVTAAVGLLLVVSGVSIQEHVYDTAVLTPGVVALVGGFLLIGLGLAVRLLKDIELALTARPALGAAPLAAGEPETARGRSPLPGRETAPALAAKPLASRAKDQGAGQPAETFPSLVRVDHPPLVEEAELPLQGTRVDEAAMELENRIAAAGKAVARRANAGTPPRTGRRSDFAPPPPALRERSKAATFDTFWPKGPRVTAPPPAAEAAPQSAAPAEAEPISTPGVEPSAESNLQPSPQPNIEPNVEPSVEQTAPPGPEPHVEPAGEPHAAEPAAEPEPPPPKLAILKSGIVDGMAYTLYSDGSIEAQLPQGTLRFGSIVELRQHIEQNS